GDAVAGDTDDLDPGFAEGRVQVAKVLRLARASRSHVLRVEIDHQGATRRILEAPAVPAGRRQGERGHFGPGLDFRHRSGFYRFQDGVEIEGIAELHELLAQM